MAVKIRSSVELQEWLEGQPKIWEQVIAYRCALRVFPLVVDPNSWSETSKRPEMILTTLRALVAALAAARFSNESSVAESAFEIAYSSSDTVKDISALSDIASFASAAALKAAAAARGSSGWFAVETFEDAIVAMDGARIDTETALLRLEADCGWLSGGVHPTTLFDVAIWNEKPKWFQEAWSRAARVLSNAEHGFEIWREWYYGRLEGLPHAFADFDHKADEKFYRWIIKKDDAWWKREPATINREITKFVDGLRKPQNAPDPALPNDAELEQNRRAIAFDALPSGQVGLRTNQNADEVDHSEAAKERHAEALDEARTALEASRPNVTQATDVERPLERYLAALGEDTFGISHALLISRGEKLRRIIASRKDASGLAIPFSETQAAALEDWLTAHNLLVGLDPFLASVERTARGPDAVPTLLDLEALKAVIESVKAQDIPNDEASEALDDLADNVPADAKADDRRLAQATEGLKNFIRGVGSLIKKHKGKIAIAGGIAGERAYAAAEWIQRNIEWLREVFVNEPSILSILEKIAALPL